MTDMLKVLSNTADGVFAIDSENQISSLTTREIEIRRLIAQCRASKDIADKLCISHRTVRTHIQNILEKLQVHSKLEAVAPGFQQNFLSSFPAEHHVPQSNPLRQLPE